MIIAIDCILCNDKFRTNRFWSVPVYSSSTMDSSAPAPAVRTNRQPMGTQLLNALLLASAVIIALATAAVFGYVRHERQQELLTELRLYAVDIADRESQKQHDAYKFHGITSPFAPNSRSYKVQLPGSDLSFAQGATLLSKSLTVQQAAGHVSWSKVGTSYAAVEKIDGTSWFAILRFPKARIESDASNAAFFALMLGLIMLAAQVLAAMSIVRSVAERPLSRLMQKIRPVKDDSAAVLSARQHLAQNGSELDEINAWFSTASENLAKSSDRELHFRKLTEHAADAILIISAGGICTYASPAVFDISGRAPEALVGRNLSDFIHGDDLAHVQSEHLAILRGEKKSTVFEYRARHYDGRWQWLETNCQLTVDAAGKSTVISVIRDVSHRKAVENRLTTAANTDHLTGLANRGQMMDLLSEQMALSANMASPLCVAMIDVDHFKTINDGFGHAAGDDVLRIISSRCKSKLRTQQLCGRFGGEEFVVVLPDADIGDAHKICDRLRSAIENEPIKIGTSQITATVSIGIARMVGGETLEQFLNRADIALYLAKNSGRNQVRLAA